MLKDRRITLVGASVRAAAFSALRGGLYPTCLDLFADADLCRHCPTQLIPTEEFPFGILKYLGDYPNQPVMYTGGLENYPKLLKRIAKHWPIWGNAGDIVRRVRDPFAVANALRKRSVPCPRVANVASKVDFGLRWLAKPYLGAGGRGIHHVMEGSLTLSRKYYLQEFIEGTSQAAIFFATPKETHLLGVTRQLVGQPWCHASGFHYCGSVGPLQIQGKLADNYFRLGQALVQAFGLGGIFGVDCIVRDAVPFPVEINPRYSASVEVLEYAYGFSAVKLQRDLFIFGCDSLSYGRPWQNPVPRLIGKSIIFAPRAIHFTIDGPWFDEPRAPWKELPLFGDVPVAGSVIKERHPVFTIYVKGVSEVECLQRLKIQAKGITDRLFPSCAITSINEGSLIG